MQAEFEKNQEKERNVMMYFKTMINEHPKDFKLHFNSLELFQKAQLRAFIQSRDSVLYNKMQKILGW